MILFRPSSSLVLWGSAAALAVCGWMRAAHASALDGRVENGVVLVALSLVFGHVLRRRRAAEGDEFGADRHALTLIVAGCALLGLSRVAGHTSLTTIREAVPPPLTWFYIALVVVTPTWLQRTARRRSVADQTLFAALALTALDGALCLLPAPAGVALGGCALATALASGRTRVSPLRSPAVLGMVAFALALTIATAHGLHRVDARPAWTWIVAATLTGLAVAAVPRSRDDWRAILAAPTVAATAVALCTAVVVGLLAVEVHPIAALRTRLTMFQQHPNFLAPFFALHATFALGLAASSTTVARRIGWGAVVALLGAATLHTDSNAGRAAVIVGLALVPGMFVVRRLVARLPRAVVVSVAALAVVGAVVGGALLIGGADAGSAGLGTGLDRVARSLDYRLDAWRNSAAVTLSSPWIGVGPNTHLSMFSFEPGSRYFNDPTSPHPHNVLLYVLQAGGVVAAAATLWWLGALLVALWRRFAGGASDDVPEVLVAAVLAGCASLAVANSLDLGLSLMTVVPAPLFALTGLVARHRREVWTPRAGPAALVAVALLLVTAGLAWRPLWARMRAHQAQLHVMETSFGIPRDVAVGRARRAMAKALANDPTLPGAHDLFARWLEPTDRGFHRALEVLDDLVALTPCDAHAHSLVAQLYKRNGMYRQAAAAYERSLAAPRAHGDRNRDRADLVWCLAKEGARDEALARLVDALRLESGVVDQVPWRIDGDERRYLPVRGGEQAPITLVEAAETLFKRHLDDEAAGRPVGRRFWMDTYNAFRDAGRDDRALEVLDTIEHELPDLLAAEPWTLDNERGKIALDAGDIDGARALFMAAYDKTVAAGQPVSFFRTQADKLGADGTEASPAADDTPQASLGAVGQILDMHPIYTDHFRARHDELVARGDPGAAADALLRLLVFTDDVVARAELLGDAARLYDEADRPDDVRECVGNALDHLARKPFPVALLLLDEHRTLPGELAVAYARHLARRGIPPAEAREYAWSLPHYFSSRTGPSLFRLDFLQATAQVDGLLKEAELLLLIDPTNIPAMWARVVALEGLGRLAEADDAMRALAEHFGRLHAPERLINDFVASVDHRADDPRVWMRVAILKLLQGYYGDAAGLFSRGREQAGDDAALEAELAQWQSRAALYAGRLDDARAALADAVALDPLRPMLARRLEALR